MNAFFTKPNAAQKIYLTGAGGYLQFKDNGVGVGVLISADDSINNELRNSQHMGVQEVTRVEYDAIIADGEAKKKAGTASRPHWREEFRPQLSMDTKTPQSTQEGKPAAVAPTSSVVEEPKLPPESFKPNAVKKPDA